MKFRFLSKWNNRQKGETLSLNWIQKSVKRSENNWEMSSFALVWKNNKRSNESG